MPPARRGWHFNGIEIAKARSCAAELRVLSVDGVHLSANGTRFGEDCSVLIREPSILITDDDPGFRETLCGVLAPQGFRTLLAADGEEALQIVRHEVVHLLLLDMHMPRLTGLETLRQVKQFKALLPCILISGDADEALRQQARRAQAFSVLTKPVSHRHITRVVRMALRRSYNWLPQG